IPGPEAPPSPDYILGPEAPPSPDYILRPEYPEYLPPADDMLPAEEQPLPAAVSPTAESPGYITESEPEMEPEENNGDDEKSEGDSIDYPTSGGDNDANDDGDDLSEDDADDEDEEESSDSEEEEEEHLAPTVPAPALYSSVSASKETEPFEEGETAATPPTFGYRVAARISIQPNVIMPFRSESEVERLLAIPTPPLSPVLPTSYPLPPFLMPLPIFTPLPTLSFPLPSSIPSTSGARTVCPTRECTYKDYLNCGPLKFNRTEGVIGLTRWFERTESVFSISNCTSETQVKFASCTLIGSALTWWNSHMREVGQEVAYAMPWKTLKQMEDSEADDDYEVLSKE
nr:hypothetical protein [Tanacetum cinerariifolium]